MCLRFVFLLAPRAPTWLSLSRRSSAWKDAEILLLPHQVALLERHSAARPKSTWADRALFATLLAVIPRARHAGLRLPVTPATILRWHRDLVKRRWAAKSRPKSPGRPPRHPTITRLVLRMARDNENRGYRRITGELAGLGITVAPSTVWKILKKHGIDPAPRRSGPTWTAFLRSQAEAIIACDFFTVDLLDDTKAHVMAAIEHATRRIHILGATNHPTHAWVTQQTRNLLMDLDESTGRIKFLIRDRDILYPPELEHTLSDAGIRTVRSAVRAPRMNAIMERWIGGCRRELLDRTLIWNLPHLRRILRNYETHHNTHRPHMALASAAPDKPFPPEITDPDAFRTRNTTDPAGSSTNIVKPPDLHGRHYRQAQVVVAGGRHLQHVAHQPHLVVRLLTVDELVACAHRYSRAKKAVAFPRNSIFARSSWFSRSSARSRARSCALRSPSPTSAAASGRAG